MKAYLVGPDGNSSADWAMNAVTAYSSGKVANATATATVAKAAGKLTYLMGFMITGAGATSAAVKDATITGLLGGTVTFGVTFPSGATTAMQPIICMFPKPIPSSAVNTDIVVSVPAGGTGAANIYVTAWGFTAD